MFEFLMTIVPMLADMSVGKGLAAIGAGIAVFTGFGSGIGEGNIAAHAMDAIGRNPEAASVRRGGQHHEAI